MELLDLTLETPAANVALDETLLDEAEATEGSRETLRFWEPPLPFVVIGRSSQADREVRLDVCRQQRVPVLRRASGGTSVVAGPGCLMYALVLSLELRPALRSLDETHRFVLEMMALKLNELIPGVYRQGTSDLALANRSHPLIPAGDAFRKFSGNSVRVKRRHVLYHGTLLYNFPLELIADYLATPPRQPTYRAGREHGSFVVNFPASAGALRKAITEAWQTEIARTDWPQARVHQLLADKYGHPEWTIEV